MRSCFTLARSIEYIGAHVATCTHTLRHFTYTIYLYLVHLTPIVRGWITAGWMRVYVHTYLMRPFMRNAMTTFCCRLFNRVLI